MGTASVLNVYAKMDEGDISLELRVKRMKTAGILTVETAHVYVQLMHH